MTQALELPFFCITPYKVRTDKNISSECKIYMGELAALTQKEGYCWATDQQLAEMKNVSIKTIEKWHTALERGGHIRRDTIKEPYKNKDGKQRIRTKRKIYVDVSFSNNVSDPSVSSGSLVTPPKSWDINKRTLNKRNNDSKRGGQELAKSKAKEKTAPQSGPPDPVVVSSELDELDLTDRQKMRFLSRMGPTMAKLMVARVLAWVGRKNDRVAFETILKRWNEWDDENSCKSPVEINRERANELIESVVEKPSDLSILIEKDCIKFDVRTYWETICFKVKDFQEKIEKLLRKYRVKLDDERFKFATGFGT